MVSVNKLVDDRQPEMQEFLAWIPAQAEVTIAFERKHEQWYALVEEFGIAGMGDTGLDAQRDAAGLLFVYLRSSFRDGCRFEDALRPISLRARLWLHIRSGLARLLSRAEDTSPDERRMDLPQILRDAPAFA